jgi:hypothetical protein
MLIHPHVRWERVVQALIGVVTRAQDDAVRESVDAACPSCGRSSTRLHTTKSRSHENESWENMRMGSKRRTINEAQSGHRTGGLRHRELTCNLNSIILQGRCCEFRCRIPDCHIRPNCVHGTGSDRLRRADRGRRWVERNLWLLADAVAQSENGHPNPSQPQLDDLRRGYGVRQPPSRTRRSPSTRRLRWAISSPIA